MAITQEVHIRFTNGELTLKSPFFYECSISNLKKVVKFVHEVSYNEDKCLSVLQQMVNILHIYYYFETLKPQKKKQIKSKLDFMIEKVEEML